MDYRIVEKPAFKVVGKALRVPTKDGENTRLIPEFWNACHRDGSHARLATLASEGSVVGCVTLGLCMDFAENMEEFTYMIAAESPRGDVPDAMVLKTIPAATWAVFEANGPIAETIQSVWGHVWAEFFPAGLYQHGDAPDLELYPPGDPGQAGYRYQVWVPVVKKEQA